MNRAVSKMTVATLLATAVLVGCKKEEPTPTIPAKTDATPAVTTPTTKPATTMPAAVTGAVDSAKAAVDTGKAAAAKEAMSKLDEITQLIKDKKYDLADAALKKLEDNKAGLPEAVSAKLPDVRKALDAAKSLGAAPKLPDVSTPAVPNLNK